MSATLAPLLELFFPPVCPACGGAVAGGQGVLCTACRIDIPLTQFWLQDENPVAERLWGHFPVERASAFIHFRERSRYLGVIHAFKYGGGWRLPRELGRWYGAELAATGLYADVDTVVPVPLHPLRRLGRGYNQSEYLAEGIAAALGKPLDTGSVRRVRNNPSQARSGSHHREGFDRWQNVEGIFAVHRPERLAGRHILLVDDVLTTGATLCSCARAILLAAPGARISVAALAATERRAHQAPPAQKGRIPAERDMIKTE